MNKKTLVWTLIVAVPVGIAALATAYVYRDTGKLPFQEPAETVTAPETASDGTQTAATPEAPAASREETSEANAGSSDADAAVAAAKGPSFDVVGVEPTGETVVAGRSDAGAIIALTANGKVVGKSIANEAGEWTIILDEPLKPGDYDVGLEVHDEAGAPVSKSEEHVVVSLPEGGKEQPLVVLNTPEGPSNILQKPVADQEVAAAEPAPQAKQTAAANAPEEVASAADTETATATSEESVTGSDGTQQITAQETEPSGSTEETQVAAASAESSEETAQAEAAPASEGTTTVAEAPAPAAAETETQTADGTQADAPVAENAAEETEVASAEPANETRSVANGAAPEDQAGTTDMAASQDASQPAADNTAAANDGQPTAGEAETPATAVADTPAVATEAETTGAAPAVAAEAAPAQAAPAEPTVTVEAVESEKDKVYVAGTGEPGSSVRVYVGDEFQGEAQVGSGGKWLVQGAKNIAEGNVEVRADLIAEDGNTVDARAAVTFEKEQDKQIVLTKVVASGASDSADGQGVEVKKALPVVIIRKGDNLWRISRRLYGQGVRYTTIYQANQDQIRNPDLIYPGQVFLTPEGDLNWKPTEENNG